MNKRNYVKFLSLAIAAILLFSSCRKRDDVGNPDNLVIFSSTAQGITAAENSITVKLILSRNTDKDIPVTINLTPKGVVYGTDFTTTPAATAGVINVTIPSGNNEASITITKVPGTLFDGDETITFAINSSAAPVLIGTDKQFTLNFSELVSTSSAYTVNGGGVTYPNKVFIDLSANRQTGILRTNWDLGFYTDPSDFRVILNSSVGMMAKQIAKNDLAAVTAADTIGFSADVAYSQANPTVSQLAYIDYPDGDLTKTAIASTSATATDNKVYIVNRGSGAGVPAPARGWKKIRIIRNAAGGYTLQHADIASATFTSVDIPKDAAYFFKYVSFETGVVPVEPEKKKWDIAWTYFGNVTNFGTGEVPYMFQDIILQNRNVSVARVLTSATTYETFNESNLAALIFSSVQTTIGADWRSGGGPTTSPAVRTDRFYIIKDGDNNYYKLRFTSLTEGGIRGFPAIEYALVKKG
jgi:hypothetical protein